MRKRRNGSRAALLLAAALSLSLGSPAQKHGKKDAQAHAIVAGTVFRESGFALPGADITLVPDAQPGQTPVKIRNTTAVSDARGEFAFHVPPTAMRYIIKARAKGFTEQQKTADIDGEVRVDVTLTLPTESK